MERIIVRIQYKKIHDKHTTKNATLLYLSSLIKIVIKKKPRCKQRELDEKSICNESFHWSIVLYSLLSDPWPK